MGHEDTDNDDVIAGHVCYELRYEWDVFERWDGIGGMCMMVYCQCLLWIGDLRLWMGHIFCWDITRRHMWDDDDDIANICYELRYEWMFLRDEMA